MLNKKCTDINKLEIICNIFLYILLNRNIIEHESLKLEMLQLVEIQYNYFCQELEINTTCLFFDNLLYFFDSAIVMNNDVITSYHENEQFKGKPLPLEH